MATNISSKELVQLINIEKDETRIEQTKLRNGDILTRSAVGENVKLTNGVQIMVRPGYFSITSAPDLTVERHKDGSTVLLFPNGDELCFNDEGVQYLGRDCLLFRFIRKDAAEPKTEICADGTFSASPSQAAHTV